MSRIAVALAAVALAAAGCSGGSEPPAEPAAVAPTPLASFETGTLTIARADFCARVAPAAVTDALGGDPEATRTWANGDRTTLAAGVTDVAHEYGCRWTAADGTTAQGWVFAPPVTPGQARRLRHAAATAPGCDRVPDAPAFGRRSVAVRCDDGTTAFHGLFGDAWLSCSVTVGAGDAVERAGRWCVSVAEAASA